jgi:hypothetical protein
MSAALRSKALPPKISGLLEAMRRLTHDYGVKIEFEELRHDVGHWDGDTRTATVDTGSPLDDQVWFLVEVWQMCAIGLHATPEAEPMVPVLTLVPAQRSG